MQGTKRNVQGANWQSGEKSINSCMSFFRFPSVTEFIDQRRSDFFSLNLMHQTTNIDPRTDKRSTNIAVVEMSHVFICLR